MDYIEAFSNLKNFGGYRRKMPHKAVLLLSIMDMYERGVLASNEIHYNDTFKETYINFWNRTQPGNEAIIADAYVAFWYMQGEDFWHMVPFRGKEDILRLMAKETSKPSESKLMDCINYAELDDDLFFMITLQSGRSSLRRALLTNYTTLPSRTIERLAESKDVVTDYSADAIKEYEEILQSNSNKTNSTGITPSIETEQNFQYLNDDLQIALNYQYFSFLKEHRGEREMFREICPSVYALYDKIAFHPICQDEISPSLAFCYENFLADLKIGLLSESDSFELIEKINEAIEKLKYREKEAKEIIVPQDEKKEEITSENSLTEDPIETQPAVSVAPTDFYVDNTTTRCFILNKRGELIYTTDGKLKMVHDHIYRFNLKQEYFTVKEIVQTDGGWTKGPKLLVAHKSTDLYNALDRNNLLNQIEDFEQAKDPQNNKIRVDGKWYDYEGKFLSGATEVIPQNAKSEVNTSIEEKFDFEPKGKYKRIELVATSSFDHLLTLAIIDFMGEKGAEHKLTFDQLACMMIANAWTILGSNPELKEHESHLVECIDFLIQESREYMDQQLDWDSDKDTIYESIKDYPMAGPFEDMVDELLENSPFTLLKAWVDTNDRRDIISMSADNEFGCLYSLHPRKIDPFIKVSPSHSRYLFFEHDNLMRYFTLQYIKYIQD